MRRSQTGFSLTELLVVVGIILVLSGIIFAVMAPSRAKAKETNCMGNLRQLYTASSLYCADNEGDSMIDDLDGHVGLTRGFREALKAYAAPETTFFCPDLPKAYHNKMYASYMFTAAVVFMPSGPFEIGGTVNQSPTGLQVISSLREKAKENMPLIRCFVHDELHYQRNDPPTQSKPFLVYVTTTGSIKAERVDFEEGRPRMLSMIKL